MNKVFGKKTDFAPIKEDASRVIISYGYVEVDEENATWLEIYLYKKQISQITLADVKAAIIADIDAQTDGKILEGYEWTILHGDETKAKKDRRIGETIKVWLSRENQDNFKEAHRLACLDATKVIPIKFKINEDEDKKAIYETFKTFDELNQFYLGAFAYIKQSCLDAGWVEKDSIDFSPYAEYFPVVENNANASE